MPLIGLRFDPPSNGWLTLRLRVGDKAVKIQASDVPNNPVQELIPALEAAASGAESSVWWHLEPDGYFMNFNPVGTEIHFSLEFAPRSERRLGEPIASLTGSKAEVLLPFWRLLRNFQSRSYQEPNWPRIDFSRMQAIKASIAAASEA